MKFEKTMAILIVAFCSFIGSHSSKRKPPDGKSSTSTVARAVRANPGDSFYILPYYFTSIFQFLIHQPNITLLAINLYLIGIKIY